MIIGDENGNDLNGKDRIVTTLSSKYDAHRYNQFVGGFPVTKLWSTISLNWERHFRVAIPAFTPPASMRSERMNVSRCIRPSQHLIEPEISLNLNLNYVLGRQRVHLLRRLLYSHLLVRLITDTREIRMFTWSGTKVSCFTKRSNVKINFRQLRDTQ